MPNFFDQFDAGQAPATAPPPGAAPAGNFFDRFDQPAADSIAGTGEDVARAVGGGLTRGTMAIPELANFGQRAFHALADKVLGPAPAEGEAALARTRIGADDAEKAVEAVTGPLGAKAAQTPTGKAIAPFAESAAEFVPMSVATGGGAIAGGIVPGLLSEAAGEATAGTAAEPYARFAGGMLSPLSRAGLAGKTPSVERQGLIDILAREGVTPTAGQLAGKGFAPWAEATAADLPGLGGVAARMNERVDRQFTEAAFGKMGADVQPGESFRDAFLRRKGELSDTFENLSQNHTLNVDPQLTSDLQAAAQKYKAYVPQNAESVIDKVHAQLPTNTIPGTKYQGIRSELGRKSEKLQSSNPPLAIALGDTQNALDAAMERTLAQSGQRDAWEQWRTAREQWGVMKDLEHALGGAGEKTAEGYVSPAGLRGSLDRKDYATGSGPLADLARAGQAILKPLPNSGTTPRAMMPALAAVLGHAAMGSPEGLPGAVGMAAAPSLAGAAALSPLGQALLRPLPSSKAAYLAPYSARAALGEEESGHRGR